MDRLAVALLVLAGLALPLSGAQRPSGATEALYAEALKARDQQDFDRAAELLRRAVEGQPSRLEYQLTLGETLGWLKRFREAESVYREATRRFPQSLEARLGLGQTLLWQENYREAERIYREALEAHPRSVAAREGIATSAYWRGDFRTARKEFDRIIRIQPDHAASKQALAEIQAATTPTFGVSTSFRRDDQPYRMTRSEASLTLFSDEVTRWTLTGGTYTLENPDAPIDAAAPFGELAAQTRIAGDYVLAARLRILRFPDEKSEVLPALSVSREFGRRGRLAVFYEQNELLFSERSLESHPSFEAFGMRWSLEADSGLSAAASARALRYFDDNDGIALDAWTLLPLLERERFKITAGPAFSWRDTDNSRFRALPGSAGGIYDPYWTPQDLMEGRGVVSGTWRGRGVELHLQGEAGVARDKVIDLNGGAPVSREFHPWSVSLGGRKQIGSRLEVTAEARRESTVFYVANEIRAGVAGRF